MKFIPLFFFVKTEFGGVVDWEQAFLVYKNIDLSRKISIFPKRLVHSFGQKFENFFSFWLLQNIGWEEVFGDVVLFKPSLSSL